MIRLESVFPAPLLTFGGLLLIVTIGFLYRWRQSAVVRVIGYSLFLQAIAIGWAAHSFLSLPMICLAIVVTVGIGFAMELCGIRYGFPFGRYKYTDVLRAKFLGVPYQIGVAWWVVCIPSFAIAVTITDHPLLQLLIGAQIVAALDMFIDPIFVHLRCWRWERKGIFFGIPLVNYGGWFLTATVIFGCIRLFIPQFTVASADHSTLIVIYILTITLHSLAMLFIWPWREWRILLFAVPLLYWPVVVIYLMR